MKKHPHLAEIYHLQKLPKERSSYAGQENQVRQTPKSRHIKHVLFFL
jgi:hypothetical protein